MTAIPEPSACDSSRYSAADLAAESLAVLAAAGVQGWTTVVLCKFARVRALPHGTGRGYDSAAAWPSAPSSSFDVRAARTGSVSEGEPSLTRRVSVGVTPPREIDSTWLRGAMFA